MRGSRSSAEEEDDHRSICLNNFLSSTHTQLTIVLSTTRQRRHDRTDVSTPPAAPATLGDGCDRTGSPGRGSAGHPLARIAQLRRGCCPPPASLLPLARGCCKPPLNRASQQLPLLSCSRRRTQPPSSASSAPHRAVTHLFAGRLKDPIASTAAHAHERAERRSNASGRSSADSSAR